MQGKKYWSDVAFGRIESVDGPENIDLFRGGGTFERIFTARAHETDFGFILEYTHVGSCLVPSKSHYFTQWGPQEIIVSGNDVFIVEENNTCIGPKGGTSVYMEFTQARYDFYSGARR